MSSPAVGDIVPIHRPGSHLQVGDATVVVFDDGGPSWHGVVQAVRSGERYDVQLTVPADQDPETAL